MCELWAQNNKDKEQIKAVKMGKGEISLFLFMIFFKFLWYLSRSGIFARDTSRPEFESEQAYTLERAPLSSKASSMF